MHLRQPGGPGPKRLAPRWQGLDEEQILEQADVAVDRLAVRVDVPRRRRHVEHLARLGGQSVE